jgi:hypothetical protein
MNPQGELSFFFSKRGVGGNEEGSKINFYGQRLALHCKNIKEKKKLLPGDRIKSSAMKFTVFP